MTTGSETRVFEGPRSPIVAAAFSPDGTRILLGRQQGRMNECDARTGEALHTYETDATSCSYNRDGSLIVASAYGSLSIYDAHNRKRTQGFSATRGCRQFSSCAWSPDGTHVVLAVGQNHFSAFAWRLETKTESGRYPGWLNYVNRCAYFPDGSRLLFASGYPKLIEVDTRTGERLRTFSEAKRESYDDCWYSPDGTRVLASDSSGACEWDSETGMVLRRYGRSDPIQQFEHTNACAYSPDGRHVFTTSFIDKSVSIWSSEGRLLRTVEGTVPFRCLAVTHGKFAAGDESGRVWVGDWAGE